MIRQRSDVPWWLRDDYPGQSDNCRQAARDMYSAAWESYLQTGQHATDPYSFMDSFMSLALIP